MQVELHPGDNRETLRRLIDEGVRVHSVVTDPPYGLVSIQKRFGKEGSAAARTEGNDGSFARLSGGFMGARWDGTGIERDPEFWRLIYDILLPGGYVFAFSGSRTGHWQACAMETAGFIMHPMHGWAFGSGFPKAHAADKAIDKMLGVEGDKGEVRGSSGSTHNTMAGDFTGGEYHNYIPGSPEAAQWGGWAYGTQAQKPALEPIYLGQKPFSEKTGAANLLKHGVGAVNIDATRVPLSGSATYGCSARSSLPDSRVCTCPSHEVSQISRNEGKNNPALSSLARDDLDDLLSSDESRARQAEAIQGSQSDCQIYHHSDDELAHQEANRDQDASTSQYDASILPVRCAKCGCIREDLSKPYLEYTARLVENKGRHPANLILDGSPEVVAMFPHGKSGTGAVKRKSSANQEGNTGSAYGAESRGEGAEMISYGDEGSAARFFHQFPIEADPLFYHAKAGKSDRAGSRHPTVKPIALMQYLIRHITPPGGTVLDPFAGSGTTGEAAKREGFDCILMEAEPEYVEFLRQRFETTGRINNSGHDLSDLLS